MAARTENTATLDLPWDAIQRLGGSESAAAALGRVGAVPLQQGGWSVLLCVDLEDVAGVSHLVISVEGQAPPLQCTIERIMRDWFSEDEKKDCKCHMSYSDRSPEPICYCMLVPSDGKIASLLLGHTRSLKVTLKPHGLDRWRMQSYYPGKLRSTLSVSLEPLLERGVVVDVVLNAAGQDFPAHRAVLAAASDVFLAMFTSLKKSKARVTIGNVRSPAVFRKFLDFFYTGALWNLSNMEADVLQLADRFQVEPLKKHCERQLFQDSSLTPVEAGVYVPDRIPSPDSYRWHDNKVIRTTVGEDYLLVEVPWVLAQCNVDRSFFYDGPTHLALPDGMNLYSYVRVECDKYLSVDFSGSPSPDMLIEVSREVTNCGSVLEPPPGQGARNERFTFVSPNTHRHDAVFHRKHTRSLAARARPAAPMEVRDLVSLGMERLVKRGALCDVVLSAAGRNFPAHRVVLAAGSDVFLAMFSGDFLENIESRVAIADVASPAAFEKFLEFLYTGNVRDMAGVQLDLLQLADRYLMPDLQDLCASSVIKSLKPYNAVALFRMSVESTFIPETVRRVAVEKLFKHWKALTAKEEWADLQRTHRDVANTLQTAWAAQQKSPWCTASPTNNPPSPTSPPASPTNVPASPTNVPASPTYSPASPTYSPASPPHSTSPFYVPTSLTPPCAATSPMHAPTSPPYAPTSPHS